MKKHILPVTIVLFALACFTGCSTNTLENGRGRVDEILKNLLLDDGKMKGDENLSLCRWYNDSIVIADQNLLAHATDVFDEWKKEGDIFSGIDSYRITSVEFEEGSSGDIIVSGTIDGAEFELLLPEKKPISWLTPPDFDE